jgi:uncharacterized protein YdhG (YjbR/CyaY superfamily)
MSAKTTTKKARFSADEKAAMKERARELKAEAERADGLADLLAKIAEMPPSDRRLAEKVHAIVTANAPGLKPKTWYGMPAYANENGKIVVFFQAADKFKYRYATLGFMEDASIDDGKMWPISYALTDLTPAEEKKITALVRKAVSS